MLFLTFLGFCIFSGFWIIHIFIVGGHTLGSLLFYNSLLIYKEDRHEALTAQSAVNATWRVGGWIPGVPALGCFRRLNESWREAGPVMIPLIFSSNRLVWAFRLTVLFNRLV